EAAGLEEDGAVEIPVGVDRKVGHLGGEKVPVTPSLSPEARTRERFSFWLSSWGHETACRLEMIHLIRCLLASQHDVNLTRLTYERGHADGYGSTIQDDDWPIEAYIREEGRL